LSTRVSGVIEEKLPRNLYRVRLDDGRAVTAAMSTQAKRVLVQLLSGDPVTVVLSPYDPTRGRIEPSP
jgi:translation initiation factor IF-1